MPGQFIHTPDEFLSFTRDLLDGKDDYYETRTRVAGLTNRYPGGEDAVRCLKIAGIL
jgi:hypothetical protein